MTKKLVVNKIKLNLDYCGKEATCGCEECQELFCFNCMEQHLSFIKFKTHTKTGLTNKVPKCFNHSTKASEFFCFDDNCCLCSVCIILKHKDHNILEIKEATHRLQKEMESFSSDEKIKKIEESIEKINLDISIRNEKYEEDLKILKENYMKDLDELGDSKLKLKENLSMLEELKVNLKSSNILVLLKVKNEFNFDFEEYFKKIYSFGYNNCGQLGLGNTTNQNTPQLISFLKNEKIKNVSCGGYHTIVTTGN
jgi:hypothetical protein